MTSKIKTVLVLGGGAKGAYIAARLHEKNVRVTIMTRPARCADIALRGVRIESLDGRFRRPIPSISPTEIEEKVGLVVVGCRSHLLVDALDQAAPAMLAGTAILSLADGGPHLPFLRRRYPLRPVLEGLFEARLLTDADGAIRHRPPAARIRLRADRHDADLLAEAVQLFSGRGLDAMVVDDFDQLAWTRAIFHAAAVGTMVYSNRPLRDALRLNSGAAHFGHMLREGRDVAAKFGVMISASMVTGYAKGLSFEGEPIAAPSSVGAPGSAGAEGYFLLAQMVDRAEQHSCYAGSLKQALRLADRAIEPALA
jgi:ketopantoate reductase